MTYTLTRDGSGAVSRASVRRDTDGAIIPADPDNADWQAYEAWCAAGNKPNDPPPLPAQIRQALGSALRDGLKATGQSEAWQAALAALSDDTRAWWTTRYGSLVPIDAVKLVRIATACVPRVDLDTLYTAAGA